MKLRHDFKMYVAKFPFCIFVVKLVANNSSCLKTKINIRYIFIRHKENRKTTRPVFCREIMAVHSNKFTKYMKLLCQRNAELSVINRVIHILFTGQRVTLHCTCRNIVVRLQCVKDFGFFFLVSLTFAFTAW